MGQSKGSINQDAWAGRARVLWGEGFSGKTQLDESAADFALQIRHVCKIQERARYGR